MVPVTACPMNGEFCCKQVASLERRKAGEAEGAVTRGDVVRRWFGETAGHVVARVPISAYRICAATSMQYIVAIILLVIAAETNYTSNFLNLALISGWYRHFFCVQIQNTTMGTSRGKQFSRLAYRRVAPAMNNSSSPFLRLPISPRSLNPSLPKH
jgi:hypothetical protein